MKSISKDELKKTAGSVQKYLENDGIIYGICLGLHMLFDYSEEGECKTLGKFKGKSVSIKKYNINLNVQFQKLFFNEKNNAIVKKLFEDVDSNEKFYFLHKYYCELDDDEIIQINSAVSNLKIPSMFIKDNIIGAQFHPELSKRSWNKIFKKFYKFKYLVYLIKIFMRIISRLDIKQSSLVKSVMFDGVRKVGDPIDIAKKYYNSSIDELMLINNTGSLYGTQLDPNIVQKIRNGKAIPISAGGGITNLDQAKKLVSAGADKIVLNTLIHQNPQEVSKIIDILGSSSVVGVIEVDTRSSIPTSAYEMSRQSSGLDLDQTIKKYLNLGVGEIVLTDVGRDGCYTGLNKDFIEIVKKYKYEAPFLISGGFFKRRNRKIHKCLFRNYYFLSISF